MSGIVGARGPAMAFWERILTESAWATPLPSSFKSVDEAVAAAERSFSDNFSLAPQQQEAVRMVLRNQQSVLLGVPSTGKATVLRALRGMAHGKADALEFQVIALTPEYLVGIDARLDDLMAASDSNPNLRVVFVGNAEDLPPVGGGAVFSSAVISGLLPSVELTHVVRQTGTVGLLNSEVDDWGQKRANPSLGDFMHFDAEPKHTCALAAASLSELQDAAALKGYALVPFKLTAPMKEALDCEWNWEDVLLAANSISDAQYDAIADGTVIAPRETTGE